MKIKTSELTGAALDWAVGEANGGLKNPIIAWGDISYEAYQSAHPHEPATREYWRPSENWSQGGPIIERENISLVQYNGIWEASKRFTRPDGEIDSDYVRGDTPTHRSNALLCSK